MTRFRSSLSALLLLGAGVAAYAQNATTPITATQLKMGGVPIANGFATIVPVGPTGAAIGVSSADGAFNAGDPRGFSFAITNGALPSGSTVPDQCTATSDRINTPVAYLVTISRTATATVPGAQYSYTIPATDPKRICGSAAYWLDKYSAGQTAVVLPTTLSSYLDGSSLQPTACAGSSEYYTYNSAGAYVARYVCIAGAYVKTVYDTAGAAANVQAALTTEVARATAAEAAAAANPVPGIYNFASLPKTLAAGVLVYQTDAVPGSTGTIGGGSMLRLLRSLGPNAGFASADNFAAEKNVANGLAGLDANAKILAAQLPSTVNQSDPTVNAQSVLNFGTSDNGSGSTCKALAQLTANPIAGCLFQNGGNGVPEVLYANYGDAWKHLPAGMALYLNSIYRAMGTSATETFKSGGDGNLIFQNTVANAAMIIGLYVNGGGNAYMPMVDTATNVGLRVGMQGANDIFYLDYGGASTKLAFSLYPAAPTGSWSLTPKGPTSTQQITTIMNLTGGAQPKMTLGAAAGTSPGTFAISGTAGAGTITVNTGTATTANAVLATVTFASAVTTAPRVCSLQPQSTNAAIPMSTSVPTTTGFTISTGPTAAPVSSTLLVGYTCGG